MKKMRNVLLIIFILISLVACAQKPVDQPVKHLPEFPSPSASVLAKLTELNDYEINAWLIKLNLFKREINKIDHPN